MLKGRKEEEGRKERKKERKTKTLIHLKFYNQKQNSPEMKVKYFQINKSEAFISSVPHYNKCQRKFFSLKKNDVRYTSGSQRGGMNLSRDKHLRQYKILVCLSLNSLKMNWIFKTKIITMHMEFFNIWKSSTCENKAKDG